MRTRKLKLRILPIVAVCFLLLPIGTYGQPSCSANYFSGIAPKVIKEKVGAKTQEICYEGYAVMFSGITRTPLWSAEHLTKKRVEQACVLNRPDNNAFHPDPNLPEAMRSELSDYAYSGFDRGHMAPSADMPTATAQIESFSLANVAPQVHENNAGIWQKLENGTRNLALNGHDVYVVSGPLFEGAELKQLKNRVLIPTGFYKAIYDATRNQATVFIIPNTEEQTSTLVSMDDLANRLDIDVFPNLSANMKSAKASFVTPTERTNCGSRHD